MGRRCCQLRVHVAEDGPQPPLSIELKCCIHVQDSPELQRVSCAGHDLLCRVLSGQACHAAWLLGAPYRACTDAITIMCHSYWLQTFYNSDTSPAWTASRLAADMTVTLHVQ